MRTTREFKTITIIPLDDDSFVGEDPAETERTPLNGPASLHLPGKEFQRSASHLDRSNVLILAWSDNGAFTAEPAFRRANRNGRHRQSGWIYFPTPLNLLEEIKCHNK